MDSQVKVAKTTMWDPRQEFTSTYLLYEGGIYPNCWQVSQKTRHESTINIPTSPSNAKPCTSSCKNMPCGGILAGTSWHQRGFTEKGMEIHNVPSHCWDDHRITVMQMVYSNSYWRIMFKSPGNRYISHLGKFGKSSSKCHLWGIC